MKRIKRFSYALCALSMAGLASCSSTGGYSSSSGVSSPYASSPFSSWYDSPMGQQIRMQQMHSQVTRSLIPF